MNIEDLKKADAQQVYYLENHEEEGGVPLLKFFLLDETGMIEHGFTTRCGGVSTGIFSTLNLSYTRGDEKAAVDENFRRTAVSLHAGLSDFVAADQTHTVNIRRVTASDRGKGILRKKDYHDVDGLITNEPGIVLSAFFADCVPLFFADPVRRACGISHSGWRGTAAGMGLETIRAMEKEFGSRPEDIYCAVGPSICQSCYEVGGDVAQQFLERFPDADGTLCRPGAPGKYQLNLWKANERIVTEAGIRPEHLAVGNICTSCNARLLFSHRASRGRRGNLGAFIKITAPSG